MSQAGCKERFSSKSSLTIFFCQFCRWEILPGCHEIWIYGVFFFKDFVWDALKPFLDQLFLTGGFPWLIWKFQVQFLQVYFPHKNWPVGYPSSAVVFSTAPLKPWMEFLPMAWFPSNMEGKTCKTLVTGLGCSNIMSNLISHDGGPALGQAGGFSRLDWWRSLVNEIKVFGCHSVRLRQSDSLFEFCNSFKPARFVIRLTLTKRLKT